MSKKTWVIISCLVLSLALGLGGSLAYLTDTDTKVNTFTMGNVDIEVEEDFVDNSELKPGLEINKDAEIVNKGSNPAYVWMTVAVPRDADPAIELIWAPGVNYNSMISRTGKDDIVYNVYTVLVNEVLAPNASTGKLLDAVMMLPNVDVQDGKYYLIENGVSTPVNYDLSKVEVIVTGYAIQQEGFYSVGDAYNAYNAQWNWNGTKIETEETPDTPGTPDTPDTPDQPQKPTTSWDGEHSVAWYTGDESSYTLNTAADLAGLSWLVNNGISSFDEITINLATDVDLGEHLWTPIGQTGATEFKGVFNGCGYTISNLYVDSSAEEGANYSSGLFGWIESHAQDITIKNVTVDGAEIIGHHNVAVIAGYLEGDSVVDNCHVKNAVLSCTEVNDDANGDKAGAIAGYVAGDVTVKNCTAENTTISAGRDAGQLLGASYVDISTTDCYAINVTVTHNGGSTGNNIKNELVGRKLP